MIDTYGKNACGICGCPAISDPEVKGYDCQTGRHYGTVGLSGSVTWHDRQEPPRTGGLFRSLLPLLVLLLLALPAAAQQWQPPKGSQVALISISGRTVARFTIDLDTPDPWSGLRWPNCGAPDSATYPEAIGSTTTQLGRPARRMGLRRLHRHHRHLHRHHLPAAEASFASRRSTTSSWRRRWSMRRVRRRANKEEPRVAYPRGSVKTRLCSVVLAV